MGVRCFGIAFARRSRRCFALGFGIAVLCGVGGCSCPIAMVSEAVQPSVQYSASMMPAPSASYSPSASYADDYAPSASADIGTTDEEDVAVAAVVDPELLKRVEPPTCETNGAVELSSGSGESGANAVPNHVIISRLKDERDCYKRAERTVRLHLERLQNALLESNAIEADNLGKFEQPSCEIKGLKIPPRGSGRPGESADPELVHIARLQVTRDCYKSSEHSVRRHLRKLQISYAHGLRT